METIAEKLQKAIDSKDAIRSVVNNKGGTITTDTPFCEYSSAISELPTGGADPDLVRVTGVYPHMNVLLRLSDITDQTGETEIHLSDYSRERLRASLYVIGPNAFAGDYVSDVAQTIINHSDSTLYDALKAGTHYAILVFESFPVYWSGYVLIDISEETVCWFSVDINTEENRLDYTVYARNISYSLASENYPFPYAECSGIVDIWNKTASLDVEIITLSGAEITIREQRQYSFEAPASYTKPTWKE